MIVHKLYAYRAAMHYGSTLNDLVFTYEKYARGKDYDADLIDAQQLTNELQSDEFSIPRSNYRNYTGRDLDIPFLKEAIELIKSHTEMKKLSRERKKIDRKFYETINIIDKILDDGKLLN